MQHWMVKSEPASYSWAKFVSDKGSAWTGVRSFPARLHLRAMKKGDQVLFYHSVEGKEVVGVAKVTKIAYPDPTVEEGEGEWVCVDLVPVRPLKSPVSLKTIKATPALKDIMLLKQSRLSVIPLTPREFEIVCQLGEGD